HSCCGWSDDPDQNVFFNTPWTREANSAQLNTSATNLMSKIVYPLSCCTQLAEKSDRNLCVRAKDGRLARKRGYIFAKVLCIIMTVPMVIEYFVAPSSPTASPDSSTASQKADSDAQQRRPPACGGRIETSRVRAPLAALPVGGVGGGGSGGPLPRCRLGRPALLSLLTPETEC
uniref:G_PROTEIN_RECEP_F1_2 domain-containing protein n=1 Tax=Macrostomum lignano TaxID=282301 RepID=A0A1I8IYU8_9PLAT